jgi:hypothetical protein
LNRAGLTRALHCARLNAIIVSGAGLMRESFRWWLAFLAGSLVGPLLGGRVQLLFAVQIVSLLHWLGVTTSAGTWLLIAVVGAAGALTIALLLGLPLGFLAQVMPLRLGLAMGGVLSLVDMYWLRNEKWSLFTGGLFMAEHVVLVASCTLFACLGCRWAGRVAR